MLINDFVAFALTAKTFTNVQQLDLWMNRPEVNEAERKSHGNSEKKKIFDFRTRQNHAVSCFNDMPDMFVYIQIAPLANNLP